MDSVPAPPVVSADEWRKQRMALLSEEKALTKQYDAVNAARRRLPMVKVDKEYYFTGFEGKATLCDLFEDKLQLIVYHFMFDPEWDKGCSGCTGFVNALGDLSMLAERDTRFVLVSRAPLEKLEHYRAAKRWIQPWYSSSESDFNYDYHATVDPAKAPPEYNYEPAEDFTGEAHGISVFFRLGEDVYHTYSSYGRGVENVTNSYALLDLTPYGRQEDFEDSPDGWPQHPTYG